MVVARPGLLKFVDRAFQERGSIDVRYFTKLVRHATVSSEIRDLLKEAESRFGPAGVSFQFLAAAAHTASQPHPKPHDSKLSAALLQKIPQQDHISIHPGVLRSVLGCASAKRSFLDAKIAFDMLPSLDRTPSDLARLIHSGIEVTHGKTLIKQMISSPAPDQMDLRVLGVFLKFSANSSDMELGTLVWSWGAKARQSNTENLPFVTVQFILMCGKAGRTELCKRAWKEAKDLGLGSNQQVQGAMVSVLARFATNEIDEYIASIGIESIDAKMLVSILSAYTHQGRATDAWNLVQKIKSSGGKIDIRAYTAVIDAFSRNGDFTSAMKVLQIVQGEGLHPDVVTWMTILSPCRYHAELPTAIQAFTEIQKLAKKSESCSEEDVVSAYVVMADVYKACGDTVSAEALHQERKNLGLKKKPGTVKVTVHGTSYLFFVGTIPERLAKYTEAIEAKLKEWSLILSAQGVSTESIECRHSEKLALAFAVIMGLKDITLEKNLRICLNCHAASVPISLHEGITIRHWDNSKRVHIMQNGSCSCGGRY